MWVIYMRYEMMKFETIRNLRIDGGYTQAQIAEYLNVKQNTYSQYENGQRQIPIGSLILLAEFYKTSVDYLLGLTDQKQRYPKK